MPSIQTLRDCKQLSKTAYVLAYQMTQGIECDAEGASELMRPDKSTVSYNSNVGLQQMSTSFVKGCKGSSRFTSVGLVSGCTVFSFPVDFSITTAVGTRFVLLTKP